MVYSSRAKMFESTNFHDLTALLGDIHARKLALPDFQRDFVWDPPMIKELIVSIANAAYAGSVLRIPNTQHLFAWREFQGAPRLDGFQPAYLGLDGQQRLTSLYQVFYGVGEHAYYVHLRPLLEGADFEDCLFHLRANTARARAYQAFEVQARDLILPLSLLKDGIDAFRRWSRQVARMRPTDEARDTVEDALSEVAEHWMWPIAEYQFPVVTLAEGTSIEAICRMFEVVNRTGVKLGPFELLTARFRPQDINLRKFREKAEADYPIIGQFAVDPYYILQIISLVTSTPPVSTRKSVLSLEASIVKGWWDRAVESLARSLEILRDDCGVFTSRWLPYRPLVLPMAAVLAKLTRPGSPTTGAIRQKLIRWFWCAVFGQAYDQGSNTQASRDVAELLEWCAGGDLPDTVREFQFDPRVLRDTTSRQSALYCGTMCLVMSLGPRDFHSGAKLTGDLMRERHIDAHHIFPHTYLHRQGVVTRLRDCVLNCTLIDRTTNQSLYTRAPADYLAQIRTARGAQHFRELLQSHLLPSEPDSPLWRNDFEGFLAWRQALLWQESQRVTGLAYAPSMPEVDAPPPLPIRGEHVRTSMPSAHEGARNSGAHPRVLAGLKGYLALQSPRTRRLWQALDIGICALAPDIAAQTTKGRRCVGGVSYYTPERLFFCADFIDAGDGLTLSVFTGGQRWEGLHLARSVPRGYAVIRTEADLPQAVAWAKAAYEVRKRTP